MEEKVIHGEHDGVWPMIKVMSGEADENVTGKTLIKLIQGQCGICKPIHHPIFCPSATCLSLVLQGKGHVNDQCSGCSCWIADGSL